MTQRNTTRLLAFAVWSALFFITPTSSEADNSLCVRKRVLVSQLKNGGQQVRLGRAFKVAESNETCPKRFETYALPSLPKQQDVFFAGTTGAPATTSYFRASGSVAASSTDIPRNQFPMFANCFVTRIQVAVTQEAPGGRLGEVRLRKNGIDSDLACSYSDDTGCVAEGEVEFEAGDLVSFKWSVDTLVEPDEIRVSWACERATE